MLELIVSLKYIIIINLIIIGQNLIFRKPYITVCSISPTTVVQAEGLDAIFLCQLPTAGHGSAIEWQINGTSWHNVNTVEHPIRREGRGNDTEALCVYCISLSPMKQ